MEKELFEACAEGNLTKVNELIKSGVNINYIDDKNNTALVISLVYKKEEICELLINKGADVNFNLNWAGVSAFNYAVSYGYKNICELSISKGANINIKNNLGCTPLMTLIITTDIDSSIIRKEICELLIKNGADINAKNNFGDNALVYASGLRKKDIVETLLSNNAEIQIGDKAFDRMLKNGWIDLCSKLMNDRSFNRRKHLLESYYSNTY